MENFDNNSDIEKVFTAINNLGTSEFNNPRRDKDDIETLEQAFKYCYIQASLEIYFGDNWDKINLYFRENIRKAIYNILNIQYIKEEGADYSALNLLFSLVKLLCIYKYNPHPELAKTIQLIFKSEINQYPFFHPREKSTINNEKKNSFWEFNKKYCSDFIIISIAEPKFNFYQKVLFLMENDNYVDEFDKTMWLEGKIADIDNGLYYINYFGKDDNNDKICFPLGCEGIKLIEKDDWDWRLNLKKNDKVDAFYKGKWVPSTVIEIKESQEKYGIKRIKYKIKYGLYDNDREEISTSIYESKTVQMDEFNNSFRGINYEEEIYHFSRKIQKYGTFSKQNEIEAKKAIENILKESELIKIDDQMLYQIGENKNIIIGKTGNFSYYFALLLKNMEKENLFNKFINELRNIDSELVIDLIETIFIIFDSSFNYLHIEFIKENKEIFKNAFLKLLRNGIEKMSSGFLILIKGFMKKIFSKTEDSYIELENEIISVILDNSLDWINIDKLDERLKGLKELNQKVRNYNNDIMADSLKKINIIEHIFGSNSHSELIKNSGDIIKNMILYKRLDENDVKLICECTQKGDIEAKKFIIELLDNLVDDIYFNNVLITNFTNYKGAKPDEIEAKFLEKLSSESNKENKLKVCKYFFDNLMESNDLNIEKNIFFIHIRNLIIKDYNIIYDVFKLYENNLKENTHCLEALLLIKNLFNIVLKINRYQDPIYSSNSQQLIEYLNNERRPLIKIFEENFKNYVLKAKENMQRRKGSEYIEIDGFSHEKNMKIRLLFLEYLTSNIYLDYNFIHLLNQLLLINPVFIEDKKYFYKFIEKFCSESEEINIKNMNRNHILCELFDLLFEENDKNNRIYTYEEIRLFIRLLYYKNYQNFDLYIIQDKWDENYEISIKPDKSSDKLIDIFWNILFKVDEEKIIKKIVDIICQISSDALIYKINDKLSSSYFGDENERKNIEKCYKLLKSFFIESEKKLLINIKPHYSLLKNCIIKFPLKIIIEDNRKIIEGKDNDNDNIELFYGNTSLNEIKVQIIKKYSIENTSFIEIETFIKKGDEEIMLDNTYGNKSLFEILEEFNLINSKIVDLSKIIYFKKKKEENLIEGKELSPKFKYILSKSFKKWTGGKNEMDKKSCIEYIIDATKIKRNSINENSSKVADMFRLDKEGKGYLTKEDIFKFYYDAIKNKNKIDLVWNNIEHMGYDSNLIEKHRLKIENSIYDKNNLFRYYLSNIEKNFSEDFIYNYNNLNPKINSDLFYFLSTNEKNYEKLLNNPDEGANLIKAIINDDNKILEKLYYLIIIESILQDIEVHYIKTNNNIFKNKSNNLQKYKIASEAYEPFDDKIEKKESFIIKLINNSDYCLINYANALIFKYYEINDIQKKCLIKCLKIIKIIYIIKQSKSIIMPKKTLIEFESVEEKGIYYFNYSNICKLKIEKIESNISYSDLIKHAFNYIINNKNRKDELFGEFFDLIIILISSEENYFSEIEKDNENFSNFSSMIKKELLSNSIFFIEKILLSLNYVSVEASKSKYISFLYDIFESIYSSILKREEKIDTNCGEYLELFKKFNKFVYGFDDFEKEDEIKKLIEILFNELNKDKEKLFPINLLFDYIDIFNNDLLKIKTIRKIIFSYKLKEKDESIFYFIYKNFIKINNTSEIEIRKSNHENINFIVLEQIDILKIEQLNNKCKDFVLSCFNIESFSLEDILNIINDILILKDKKKLIEDNGSASSVENLEIKENKFVGLKNLGATCYMNSILQQLFMIYPFRYAILATNKNFENRENRFMKELQILYSNLELSVKKYFEPFNFCGALDIDIKVQEDSQQFYISLCDNVEKGLKSLNKAKYLYIINDTLMGEICSSYKCASCGYISYKFENFIDLSLEVKNLDNIKDSLHKYIQKEIIDDHRCSHCSKKGTEKSSTLSKLPNNLIFHLKRFTISYENNSRIEEKITSKFEFPFELNLKEFCTESSHFEDRKESYEKEDDYYKYILKGVVLHSGSAQGGHYISLIDVNREGKGNILKNEKQNWFEFNDSIIKKFDKNDLEKESFGNEKSSICAYLLFYERIKKSPIHILIDEQLAKGKKIISFGEEDKKEINKKYDILNIKKTIKDEDFYKLIFYNKTKNEYFQYIPYYDIIKELPERLYNGIINENNIIRNKAKDNDISKFNIEKLNEEILNKFMNTINSEDFHERLNSLEQLPNQHINNKFKLIKMYISLCKGELEKSKSNNSENINKKLQILFKNINLTEQTGIHQIIKLSETLITKSLFDIFFTDKNLNENYIKSFISIIIQIISIISKNSYENLDSEKEIYRIVDVFLECYKSYEKKYFSEFHNLLLTIIEKDDEKILSLLMEKDFLKAILEYNENKLLEAEDFKSIKIIIKMSDDYNNPDLFFIEKKTQAITRNKFKLTNKNFLKSWLIKKSNNSEVFSNLAFLFYHEFELLIILSKILCYRDLDYSIQFYFHCNHELKFNKKIWKDFPEQYFNIYFNIIEIKDEFCLERMKIILGIPRLILNIDEDLEKEEYFYENWKKYYEKDELNIFKSEPDDFLEDEEKRINIGESIIKFKKYDLKTPIYEYKNTNCYDERINGFFVDIFYHDSNFLVKKNLIIFNLLNKCFSEGGNYNIFKYLYLLPARSLYYDNEYQELYDMMDDENKKKIDKNKNLKEKFIEKINFEINMVKLGKDLDSLKLPQGIEEYHHDIDCIKNFLGYICEYIPGNLIKKEFQIVERTDSMALVKTEYYTKFYTVEQIRNKFNIFNYNIKDIDETEKHRPFSDILKGTINFQRKIEENHEFVLENFNMEKCLLSEIRSEAVKRFKNGEKIIIKYNPELHKRETGIKTLIHFTLINYKLFRNTFDFIINIGRDLPDSVKNNAFMIKESKLQFINCRKYKIFAVIQRKSLKEKFFGTSDVAVEINTKYLENKKYNDDIYI